MRHRGNWQTGTLAGAILTSSMLLAGNAVADEESALEFEISAGIEYSSRVAVDEVDTVSPDGDLAALLDAGVAFSHDLTEDTEIDLGYRFSTTVHDELGQFDMQSHFGSLDLSHDFGQFDVGIAQRLSQSSLDGADFLNYQQTAPYVTALLGKKHFLRAEVGFAKKDFDVVSERDADIRSVGADWFVFLRGANTYLTFGYRFDQEDAVTPQYDYDRHNFKAHFVQRLDVFGRSAKLNLGIRYEDREYSDVWPSIGVNREEQRQKVRASLDLPLTERFGTLFKYELRDVQSNLPEADRSDQIASIELVARF